MSDMSTICKCVLDEKYLPERNKPRRDAFRLYDNRDVFTRLRMHTCFDEKISHYCNSNDPIYSLCYNLSSDDIHEIINNHHQIWCLMMNIICYST